MITFITAEAIVTYCYPYDSYKPNYRVRLTDAERSRLHQQAQWMRGFEVRAVPGLRLEIGDHVIIRQRATKDKPNFSPEYKTHIIRKL